MTPTNLISSKEFTLHHTASKKGYITKKQGIHAIPYKGRFGEGYIICYPNAMGADFWKGHGVSHNLHRIDYYIKNN